MEELIKGLNELKITQTSMEWGESDAVDDELFEKLFPTLDDYQPIASGLDVDQRRWYETSISVYKVKDGFLGVRHISNLYSESSSVDDIGWVLQFFEMEKYMVVTYKEKR